MSGSLGLTVTRRPHSSHHFSDGLSQDNPLPVPGGVCVCAIVPVYAAAPHLKNEERVTAETGGVTGVVLAISAEPIPVSALVRVWRKVGGLSTSIGYVAVSGITTVVGVICFALPVSRPTLTGLFLIHVPNTGSGIANTSNGTGDTGADSNGAY